MLRMPFSSVVVWSCGPARTDAASHTADSDVESRIVPCKYVSTTKLPANPIQYPAQWICGDERRNAMKNGRGKRKAETSSLVELFVFLFYVHPGCQALLAVLSAVRGFSLKWKLVIPASCPRRLRSTPVPALGDRNSIIEKSCRAM
jgi:hypothetical protein